MPTNDPAWPYAVECCTAVPCSCGRERHPVENWLIPGQIISTEPKHPCFNLLGLDLLKKHYQKKKCKLLDQIPLLSVERGTGMPHRNWGMELR